ncbi:NUDIX hydrolase [Rhizobium sp. RAF56]|jgi:8-oxo-dGTP pyrophosphatase MutT (NUDIX family)|uniref:NUDIX hydrolase n=1 Tax=Rhizobium sp. RAF56 TaxID=3233062 RepID=UPI003F975186
MFQEVQVSQSNFADAEQDVEQAGAICLRRSRKGKLRVLLVGSRRNGRWGLPKGHVEQSEGSNSAAAREAFEEAGVLGSVEEAVFGTFTYFKDTSTRRYHVTVHLLTTTSVARSFPEKAVRKTRWFSLEDAINVASQPGLRALLQTLT